MQSSKPPQIIVIPSSLLQQKHTPIKISPQAATTPYRIVTSSPPSLTKAIISPNSVSSQMTLNRAVLSPSLSLSQKPIKPIVTRPIATVVGSKRPAPVSSPPFNIEAIKFEKEANMDSESVRKRANLDHLTPEERLMRRKLKNRVAAQTARDKKKAQTDDMERLITDLQEEKDKLEQENNRLQATNTQLQIENLNLQQDNIALRSRLNQDTKAQTEILEIELPPSPVSLPPSSPKRILTSPSLGHSRTQSDLICSPALQPPESAAGAGLQVQEQSRQGLSFPLNSNRVVVERLDSLDGGEKGQGGLSHSDLVCPMVSGEDKPLFYITPCHEALLNIAPTPQSSSAQKESKIEPQAVMDPTKCFFNPATTRVSLQKPTLDMKKASDDIFDDLGPILDTPTAEKLLDNFLSEAEQSSMMLPGADIEPPKWTTTFDDLFPDLD